MNLIIHEIENDIRLIKSDQSLLPATNFIQRTTAIDFLDFHIIDRIESLPNTTTLATLKQSATSLKIQLETIDTDLFEQLRNGIRSGMYRGDSFKLVLQKYLGNDVFDMEDSGKTGYDHIDTFINGVLIDQPIPETAGAREAEMVFYQQTPVRIIFQLAYQASLTVDDVLIDIGSGLGHVGILLNLLTGIKTKGIEYEPVYCNYATAIASKLNLPDVDFVNVDARFADYSAGTIFFLYTPFTGSILQDVLTRLMEESLKRKICIFTYGPCSPVLAGQNWLLPGNNWTDNIYQLARFNSVIGKE